MIFQNSGLAAMALASLICPAVFAQTPATAPVSATSPTAPDASMNPVVYQILFRAWFPANRGSPQNMKKYGSLSLGKSTANGITPVVHRSSATQKPLQFRVKRRLKDRGVLSFHVHPEIKAGTDSVLALVAFGNQPEANVTAYDIALIDNPKTFSAPPGVSVVHWHDWVLEDYSLKPDLVNTSGIWRAYDDLGLPAKGPFSKLQGIDQEAIRIYYDTNPKGQGLGSDISRRPLADVHLVKKKMLM